MRSKTQPHNEQAEEGVIACCLIDESGATINNVIARGVTGESFYVESNRVIFDAMASLLRENCPCDEITLFQYLESSQQIEAAGGLSRLFELQRKVDTPVSVNYYADIVAEAHAKRTVIRLSRKLQESCLDPGETADQIRAELARAVQEIEKGTKPRETIMTGADLAGEAIADVKERIANPENSDYRIKTGIHSLDHAMTRHGFGPGEMVVIAARPSVGKTALAMHIAHHNAVDRPDGELAPTLFFSMEMLSLSLTNRLACAMSGIPASKLGDLRLDDGEQRRLRRAYDTIAASQLYVDKQSTQTLSTITARAQELQDRLKRQGKRLECIIVDYLQLIEGQDNRIDREKQIAEFSRGLKKLAMQYELPLIVLSQINRESERNARRPRMSDLRESGAIEQDADNIIMLHRPTDRQLNSDPTPNPTRELIEVIAEKLRNGPVGSHDVIFHKNLTRFENP
jgi:replicative DNA helicase